MAGAYVSRKIWYGKWWLYLVVLGALVLIVAMVIAQSSPGGPGRLIVCDPGGHCETVQVTSARWHEKIVYVETTGGLSLKINRQWVLIWIAGGASPRSPLREENLDLRGNVAEK